MGLLHYPSALSAPGSKTEVRVRLGPVFLKAGFSAEAAGGPGHEAETSNVKRSRGPELPSPKPPHFGAQDGGPDCDTGWV